MVKVTWSNGNSVDISECKRYVKLVCGEFKWCLQGKNGLDVRQGTCDEEDLPQEIVEKCKEKSGKSFEYCEWKF